MDLLVGGLASAAVWLLANGVYLNARRRGTRGFVRLVAFWTGLPGTVVSMMLVRRGAASGLVPPPDDERALFEEVRRDRARRALAGPGEPLDRRTGPP
jgi:hypothetical protein